MKMVPGYDSIAKYILSSAATAYYCDLKNETVRILQDADIQTEELKDKVQDFRQAVDYYANEFVHPDDRHILYENLNLEYARKKLKESENYSFNYREVYGGREATFRGIVMRGEDEDHLVILFWNISEDLDREKRHIQAANDAQKLVDNITATFNIVYLIDMSDDSLQIKRMDGHMLEKDGHFEKFSQARQFFLDKVVHFRDREYMQRELDFDTIRRRLAQTPTYSVEYRVLKDGITLGGEMNVTAIEGEHIIIGMAGSDLELVMRHMQKRRYDEYFALFVIDLDTEMLKVMKTSPWYKTGKVGEAAPYSKVIQAFAQTLDEGPKEFFMRLSNLDYIKQVLAHENKHSYSYKSNLVTEGNKWVNVVSYVTIRHEDGTPAEFTLGFSLVDSMERRTKEADLRIKEDMHMIGGLASNYHALYYVNLKDNIFKVYSIDGKRLPDTKQLLASGDDCFTIFQKFAQSDVVHPNDRHLFTELNVDSVRVKLAHSKKFTIRFRRDYGHGFLWSEMDIIKYESIHEQANTLIIGFAEVDEIVHKQIEQQEQHHKNMEIIEALASDYSSVYYYDFTTNEITPFSMNDEMGMSILEIFRCSESFSDAYQTCVKSFVYEPDRDMMNREGTQQNILDKLSEGRPFVLTFRRMMDGKISFCEIKFVAAHREKGKIESIGFGITYKDDEIMAQFLNEKLISEYISAFMVNLDDDRYRIYRHPSTTKVMDREDRRWSLAMADFAAECDRDFYELVKSIGSPAFLRSELASVDRREYLYRFPSSTKPWRRCVILVLDRENGIPKNVVATFMGIDDFQSKIKDQEAQLKQQLEMIGGLASGYHALYYFNIKKHAFKLYSIDKQRFPEIKDIIGRQDGNPLDIFLNFGRSELVHPDDRHLFEELTVNKVLEELAHKKKFTTRFRRRFGNDFLWTELDIINYEDIDETPNTIVLGFAERDKEIRREKEAAAAQDLVDQQRHIKAFGDMINAALWSVDAQEDNKIIAVDWSNEFRHMLGYENETDFPNVLSSWTDLLHPEDKQRTIEHYMAALHSQSDGFVFDIQYRILKKSGEYCWYHAIGRKENNNDGTIRLYGIITDISADKQLERQHALSDGLAREYHTVWLVDGFGDHRLHLFRSTGNKTIKSAVQRGLDEPTYDSTMVKYVMTSVHEDDRQRVLEASKYSTVARETPDIGTYVISYKRYYDESGHTDYHQMCFAKAVADDGTVNYILAFRDADKMLREQIERQTQLNEALTMAQAANRAKTTFLNNMSHDIRTPMNAIIGFTNLATSHIEETDKVLNYLSKIGQSSNHLLSLINDVLDMSRIESGKMILDESKENLSDIIYNLRDIVQADLHAKQHSFFIDTMNVMDKDIICDKLRLNQVLLNILSNSIKYTAPGGTISLCISEKNVKISGYAIYEFRIRDNGMGMSPDYLKVIFEPFTRVKSTTVSGIQGTGLGMAITKNIVDMMGGKIEVRSQLGKGTETILTFEFKLASPNADFVSVTAPKADEANVEGLKILLVEDNELNREIATAILEEMGCIVTAAQDGDIAVNMMKAAKKGDYDIVLMDIQMPTMDGYEATRQIRAQGTDISRIPIIAMTANAFDDDRKAALEAGMDEHIAKPINDDQLRQMLARFSV